MSISRKADTQMGSKTSVANRPDNIYVTGKVLAGSQPRSTTMVPTYFLSGQIPRHPRTILVNFPRHFKAGSFRVNEMILSGKYTFFMTF